MKIAICGSLNFTHKIKHLRNELKKLGFNQVYIPISSKKIVLNGKPMSIKDKLLK